MYDLDKILDEVRTKYYASKILPRPNILWSDEHWTAINGKYDLYNNQITVSRAFNSNDISYEALASVVYHESLHQDFADHDRKFMLRANRFPNYKTYAKELDEYLSDYSLNLKYDKIIADYSKGKNEVAFVIIPYLEDFQNAFTFYDGNIYIDTEAQVSNVSKSNLTIFLVDNGKKYHIVAWAENVEFFKEQKQILHGDFGGLDFSYRISALRDNVKILFDTTCTYAIWKNAFPASLETDKFCVYNIGADLIQEDIKYINSYCEGFYELGMAPFAIGIAAPYEQLPYKELYEIAVNEAGFRGIWAANALCKIDLNYDTLFNRADALRDSGLITLAYNEMKKAYSLANKNPNCTAELIKLCAMVSDFSLGNQLIKELSGSIAVDEYLANSIAHLQK